MSKTDDRASQYKFVEDEDIFEEDEKRLAARKKETGWVTAPTYQTSHVSLSKELPRSSKKKPDLPLNRFRQDPVIVKRDAAKFHRAVRLLLTDPPPSSKTNPQFTLQKVTDLLTHQNNLGDLKTKWKEGLNEEKLGHDVYLNSNKYVESLEQLRQQLTERFVYKETSSHLTDIPSLMTERDKELQKRNGWIKSPASRVNNLSQRQIFYSQFSKPVRTFTVDNKKAGFLRSHSESKLHINTNFTKRALFQSPEKQNSNTLPPSNYSSASSSYSSTLPPSNYSVPSAASTSSTSSSSSLVTPASRSLLSKWSLSRGDTKQPSSSSSHSRDASSKKNCSKSLKFDEPTHEKSDTSVKKPKKLSQLHSKKMLWAVETLLKKEGVVSSDPEYKMLYANVYRKATQVWLKYYDKNENGKLKDSATGTSDLMVCVAKNLLPGVEQSLGITCGSIKSRKEESQKNADASLLLKIENESLSKESKNDNTINSSSKVIRTESNNSFDVIEEVVFSPEVLGVSTLCEGIDAVISSLDDLPPDPGDNAKAVSASTLPIPMLSSIEQNNTSTSSCVKDLLAAPLICADYQNLTRYGTAENSKTGSSDSTTVSSLNIDIVDSATLALPDNISKLTDVNPDSNLPDNINVSSTNSIYNLVRNLKSDPISTIPNSFDNSNKISDTTKDSTEENNSNTAEGAILDTVTNNCYPSNISNCIVKIENCDHILSTDERPITTLALTGATCASTENTGVDSYKADLSDASLVDGLESSPGKSSLGSDRRRSKRKRNCGSSSNENTPTPVNLANRTSKRICSNKTQVVNINLENSGGVRKSSRNKVSDDSSAKKCLSKASGSCSSPAKIIGSECDIPVEMNVNDEEEAHLKQSGDDSQINLLENKQNEVFENHLESRDKKVSDPLATNNSSDSGIVAGQQDGSSTSASNREDGPNNIDKENDSSMENISDVDTQNWSPILKLKRSSKNLWSSELRKKRISSRRKKERSENSPVGSPFLDLEGPFKYRLCKRALPGQFVSAIIKGEKYAESYMKLVKKKAISSDCILVRSVQEGLELRIPLELFQRERIFLGTNKFQNIISDITEDAICKLEGIDFNHFSGFTSRDINQAAMKSCTLDRVLKVIKERGEVVKPLFTVYNYAIVKQTPKNLQDFYQILVEISRSSLFLRRNFIDQNTIQVRPMKSESPKKIQLEINIPVCLVVNSIGFKENILKDLNPVHNIISC